MPSTRSSARIASKQQSASTNGGPAGHKRRASQAEAEAGGSPKRGRKTAAVAAEKEKKQKTLEETVGKPEEKVEEESGPTDEEMREAEERVVGEGKGEDGGDRKEEKEEKAGEEKEKKDGEEEEDGKNGEVKGEKGEVTKSSNGAIEDFKEKAEAEPSTIIEKGIIYFFTRARVGMGEPESVSDLQRSYFVLRPLPAGAQLTDGTIDDEKKNRLFAVPKKVFPKSHRDRFMAFVEKAHASVQELKEDFLKGSQHETKTRGTREVPPVTPLAEGVYAITQSGRSSHLVYMLTIPQDIGEVQKELGLAEKGSFVVSVKNPERGGPSYAQLDKKPEFPKEIIEEFRGLAWVPVKPNYLDYPNAQILLIGEHQGDEVGKVLEASSKDQKQGKDEPKEVLEKLEHEDELRVEHLHGDDTVFDDLHISKKEFPSVPSTW